MHEAWSFEHSIECPVAKEFAWQFWTNVQNWKLDSDLEAVELNGPFAAGSKGASITRSSGRIEWQLTRVQPENEAAIEIPLPGATGQFRWTFQETEGGTRITQRVSLSGE